MSKNTKEKSGYYCFPTPLYEMNVIVAFGKENIKQIGDKFKFRTEKGRENLLNSNGYIGFTNFAIDENNNKVVLIVFPDRKVCTTNVLCHEAFHAMDYLASEYGLDFNPHGSNEHLAYLIGYIASNIAKALYDDVEEGIFRKFSN